MKNPEQSSASLSARIEEKFSVIGKYFHSENHEKIEAQTAFLSQAINDLQALSIECFESEVLAEALFIMKVKALLSYFQLRLVNVSKYKNRGPRDLAERESMALREAKQTLKALLSDFTLPQKPSFTADLTQQIQNRVFGQIEPINPENFVGLPDSSESPELKIGQHLNRASFEIEAYFGAYHKEKDFDKNKFASAQKRLDLALELVKNSGDKSAFLYLGEIKGLLIYAQSLLPEDRSTNTGNNSQRLNKLVAYINSQLAYFRYNNKPVLSGETIGLARARAEKINSI